MISLPALNIRLIKQCALINIVYIRKGQFRSLLRSVQRLNHAACCCSQNKTECTALVLSFNLEKWRKFLCLQGSAIRRSFYSECSLQRYFVTYSSSLYSNFAVMRVFHVHPTQRSFCRQKLTHSEFTTSFENKHNTKGIREALRRMFRPCKRTTDYINESVPHV